jgi:hypothetical protein
MALLDVKRNCDGSTESRGTSPFKNYGFHCGVRAPGLLHCTRFVPPCVRRERPWSNRRGACESHGRFRYP